MCSGGSRLVRVLTSVMVSASLSVCPSASTHSCTKFLSSLIGTVVSELGLSLLWGAAVEAMERCSLLCVEHEGVWDKLVLQGVLALGVSADFDLSSAMQGDLIGHK